MKFLAWRRHKAWLSIVHGHRLRALRLMGWRCCCCSCSLVSTGKANSCTGVILLGQRQDAGDMFPGQTDPTQDTMEEIRVQVLPSLLQSLFCPQSPSCEARKYSKVQYLLTKTP